MVMFERVRERLNVLTQLDEQLTPKDVGTSGNIIVYFRGA